MAGIYLNEDNSHYFMERAEKASDMKEIRDFILQYEGTNVEKMFLCASCQKTNFPTKNGSIIFEDVDYDSPLFDRLPNFKKWSMAVSDIVGKGMDIYSIWIDTLREIGISPWMSMRMNDVHNADDVNAPIHSSFYKQNLDYRRSMYRDEKWEDRQLNYLLDEVQDYHFNLVLDYFEKYDFDGLELDWMRFGNHFPAGYEDEGRQVLDDFMKRTKETALKYEKIRGHRIELAARVPVKPESAFDMGMDGAGWARAGYVDYLIPSPFWHTSQADIPVERWKQLIYGTGCRIAPCIEICLRQYAFPGCKNEFQYNSIETIKGAAKSFVDRGADAVYLFNYMDRQNFPYDDAGYREIITSVGKNELMNKGIRRHILTFNDRQPEGMPSDERLPCVLKKKKFEGFRIHTGKAVTGETRFALLSFKGREDIGSVDIEVYANGKKCVFDGKKDPGHPRPVNTAFAWRLPAESVKDGYQ
ncbi:MAG: hypothetical protein R6W99_00170, partial [Clostridia bacterium]